MNMNHPLRVMLPLAGFCVSFAVMAQTQPNQAPQPNQQAQQPASNPSNQAQQPQAAPKAQPQPNQPSMVLGGPNNDNQVNQHKAQMRQQAIQMIEQGLNNLRQSQ